MLLVGGAWLVLPSIIAILFAVGKVDVVWVWIGLAVCKPFSLGSVLYARFFLRYETSIKSAISIEQYLTEDPRPPVLYLRPFKMDYYMFAERDECNWPFELYFGEVFRELRPFVALGNPEDYVPFWGGAVRLYANDNDWVQKLDELARRSSCIVVETAKSENLRLEYEYLRREGMQEKLFVFTGQSVWAERRWLNIWQRLRFGTLHVDWQRFSEGLAMLGYDLSFSDPGLGSVITFNADGRGVFLTTQAKKASEFVQPIQSWIARREKIGRCLPISCHSCGREFHVFPADIASIRERWCWNCGEGSNTLQRAAKKFTRRHGKNAKAASTGH